MADQKIWAEPVASSGKHLLSPDSIRLRCVRVPPLITQPRWVRSLIALAGFYPYNLSRRIIATIINLAIFAVWIWQWTALFGWPSGVFLGFIAVQWTLILFAGFYAVDKAPALLVITTFGVVARDPAASNSNGKTRWLTPHLEGGLLLTQESVAHLSRVAVAINSALPVVAALIIWGLHLSIIQRHLGGFDTELSVRCALVTIASLIPMFCTTLVTTVYWMPVTQAYMVQLHQFCALVSRRALPATFAVPWAVEISHQAVSYSSLFGYVQGCFMLSFAMSSSILVYAWYRSSPQQVEYLLTAVIFGVSCLVYYLAVAINNTTVERLLLHAQRMLVTRRPTDMIDYRHANKHERPLHNLHQPGQIPIVTVRSSGPTDDLSAGNVSARHRKPHTPFEPPHVVQHRLAHEMRMGHLSESTLSEHYAPSNASAVVASCLRPGQIAAAPNSASAAADLPPRSSLLPQSAPLSDGSVASDSHEQPGHDSEEVVVIDAEFEHGHEATASRAAETYRWPAFTWSREEVAEFTTLVSYGCLELRVFGVALTPTLFVRLIYFIGLFVSFVVGIRSLGT